MAVMLYTGKQGNVLTMRPAETMLFTAQHSTAQHSTAQHSTAQHSTASAFVILKNSTTKTALMISRRNSSVGKFLYSRQKNRITAAPENMPDVPNILYIRNDKESKICPPFITA